GQADRPLHHRPAARRQPLQRLLGRRQAAVVGDPDGRGRNAGTGALRGGGGRLPALVAPAPDAGGVGGPQQAMIEDRPAPRTPYPLDLIYCCWADDTPPANRLKRLLKNLLRTWRPSALILDLTTVQKFSWQTASCGMALRPDEWSDVHRSSANRGSRP